MCGFCHCAIIIIIYKCGSVLEREKARARGVVAIICITFVQMCMRPRKYCHRNPVRARSPARASHHNDDISPPTMIYAIWRASGHERVAWHGVADPRRFKSAHSGMSAIEYLSPANARARAFRANVCVACGKFLNNTHIIALICGNCARGTSYRRHTRAHTRRQAHAHGAFNYGPFGFGSRALAGYRTQCRLPLRFSHIHVHIH